MERSNVICKNMLQVEEEVKGKRKDGKIISMSGRAWSGSHKAAEDLRDGRMIMIVVGVSSGVTTTLVVTRHR